MNNSFCIHPWIQPDLNQDGTVAPCCKVTDGFSFGSLKESNFSEIWNSNSAREMRRLFLEGKYPEQCIQCKRDDDAGIPSLRSESLSWHGAEAQRILDSASDFSEISSIRSLAIRFSNLCNFKCRICGPKNTSSWDLFVPKERLVRLSERTREGFWNLMDRLMPQIDRVYFAGGEPTLDPDHFTFLERLIEAGRTNVILSYNTNLSTVQLKDQRWLKLLNSFSNVQIGISVDAIDERAEVLRSGTNWVQIEENIKILKTNAPRAKLNLNPTVSVMNVFHLPDAIEYWIKSGILSKQVSLIFNFLSNPRWFSINILNPDERAVVLKRYRALMEKYPPIAPQCGNVIKFFSGPANPEDRNVFRFVTFAMDQRRKESFSSVFPECRDLLRPDTSS